MRNILSRFRRPYIAGMAEQLMLLNSTGDGSTLSLDFTTGVLDPSLTFTRSSDATFINSQGLVQYADANHVQNSTMLNNTGSKWTQSTSGTGSVTINGDGTVRFNGTGGRATWLQTISSLASGLSMTFSFRVTSFTNTNLRTTDMFNAGSGFTGQAYFYTDTNGTTHSLTAFESLPKSGTNGIGTYSVTATTTATSANIIFGSDCNGVGGRNGDVAVTEPQLQYGTVVPRRVYVPNSSTTAAKWDSARFDYDPTTLQPRGLLIEGSATNLLTYSQAFTPDWTDTSITRDVTLQTSPDGTANALRITASAGNATIIRSAAIGTSASRTFSVWLRRVSGSGNIQYTQDNGTTYTTQAITSSWVRYQFTHTANHQVGIRIVTSGDSIELWGAQLETSSGGPSSYIPTGASTATRAADECQILDLTTMGFNANAGTIYTDVGIRRNTGSNRNYTFLPASGSNNQIFEGSGTALNVYSSGSFVAQIGTSTSSASKIAAAYALDDYAVSVNGGAVTTDTSGALPSSLTKLTIGGSIVNAAAYTNACIRVFKYWPTRLSNAQLQSLTT